MFTPVSRFKLILGTILFYVNFWLSKIPFFVKNESNLKKGPQKDIIKKNSTFRHIKIQDEIDWGFEENN